MDRIRVLGPADTGRCKAALERKFRELASLPGRADELHIESLADPMDKIQTNVDRDIAVVELDHRASVLREVREALAKMAGGDYGNCEHCGVPIVPKRLDAVPWARLCLSCQSDAEQRGGETVLPSFDKAA